MDNVLFRLLLGIPGFFLAIVPHEVAHAWVADKLGDHTARYLGRITLDPRKHFDPIGALVYVVTMLMFSRGFGWAKPVPIQPWHFRDRRAGMALTGLAGPVVNLAQAVVWGLLLRFLVMGGYALGAGAILAQVLFWAFMINLVVFVFNMIPIPPLDGSRLLAWMLPVKGAQWLDQLEHYGAGLVFLLVMLGGFRYLWPVVDLFERLILG